MKQCIKCQGFLGSRVEVETGICDDCDRKTTQKLDGGPIRTERYRCDDCNSVLYTEEEEANMMCEGCMEESE